MDSDKQDSPPPRTPASPTDGASDAGRNRSSTASSGRLRSASLRFLESNPPSGMWMATGTALAQAPTPLEIRRGSFGYSGWDGEMQRRNSTVSEESVRRLSRTPSAQTPGSLGRSPTNPMTTHAEAIDEGEQFPKFVRQGETSDQAHVPNAQKAPQRSATAGDDDDPFSMFVGRGRIDDQSYAPKQKTAAEKVAAKRKSADPYAIPDDDDHEEEEIDPLAKPKGLPKKFLDPASEKSSKPNEKDVKLTAVTTGTARPSSSSSGDKEQGPDENGVYPTGYKFPPKHTWGEATRIGLKAFWRFTITPLGFLIVLYGLNVVAWGGMLFLLLIGGGQEFMCYPPGSHGVKECNNINSPRRIWIEIDSQILNALFGVTGFGLIPWRFRDLYYLLQFRLRHKQDALRRLGGIHRSWFRLPGSQELPTDPDAPFADPENNPATPIPASKAPDAPLTGIRAPASKMWKLDYVIWAYVLNTFLQAVLSGFMWGLNRYNRPSWSTGLFVALACTVAALGGLMAFLEGKRVKAVEGIPVKEEEMLRDVERDVIDGEKKNGKSKRRNHTTGGKGSAPEVRV
ncbi:hypothetical protein OEA41_001309 [Lepraria neglecta]|uniref:Uncharacterized protein n=1 Tax=Lepraria neglecta TaxID=209136 RepID=A0AAD9Z9V2_9LECA|nr:hypothetical protein OEA41_001309 [Lepraria neglecta]